MKSGGQGQGSGGKGNSSSSSTQSQSSGSKSGSNPNGTASESQANRGSKASGLNQAESGSTKPATNNPDAMNSQKSKPSESNTKGSDSTQGNDASARSSQSANQDQAKPGAQQSDDGNQGSQQSGGSKPGTSASSGGKEGSEESSGDKQGAQEQSGGSKPGSGESSSANKSGGAPSSKAGNSSGSSSIRSGPAGKTPNGGLGNGNGEAANQKLAEDTSKPLPHIDHEAPNKSGDTVAPEQADANRAALALRKIEDLLKENKVTPDLEKEMGMSKSQMEQFVTKLKNKIRPAVEGGRELNVKPNQSAKINPNRKVPGLKPGTRVSSRSERGAGSVAQDDIRGNAEGAAMLPPAELRSGFELYKSSLSAGSSPSAPARPPGGSR